MQPNQNRKPMTAKNMSNITAEVSHMGTRYQGKRTDTIWVHWDDPDGNRYHFWLHPVYDGRDFRARGLDVVDKDTIYVNPREGMQSDDPRWFKTKHLKASAKCNQPLIQRAFAEVDIQQAYRNFELKEQAEQALRDAERLAVQKKAQLEAAAPALLAATKMLLEFVPQKCKGAKLVPVPNDPQNVAIDIANAAILQAEGSAQ